MTILRDVISSLITPPQINVPLLRKTLEYGEDHPEEINLGSWAKRTACGTTACLAGTAVLLAGLSIDWDMCDTEGKADLLVDGRHIADVAQELLGLTDEQENDLFYCSSLDQAWVVAEELTNGEIQRPAVG